MELLINNKPIDCKIERTRNEFFVDKDEFLACTPFKKGLESIFVYKDNKISLEEVARVTCANEKPTFDERAVYLFYSNITLKNPLTLLDSATSISNFRNAHRISPYSIVTHDDNFAFNFDYQEKQMDFSKIEFTYGKSTLNVKDSFKEDQTVQLLVIKDNRIVGSYADKGYTGKEPFLLFSVAKSLTSMALGAAIDAGYIDSVHDKVIKYVPELEKSGYKDVTIDQCMCMRSGIDWIEDNNDGTQGQFFEMFDYAFSQDQNSINQYLVDIKTKRSRPGEKFNYVTVDSHVIQWVIKNSTGKSLSEFFAEKIWSQIGTSEDARWCTDLYGNEFSGSFFLATPEDCAKLGQLMLQDGNFRGKKVLSKEWINHSIHNRFGNVYVDKVESTLSEGYNANWWIPEWESGVVDFTARGIMGQFIYVNKTHNVVIVKNSIDYKFDGKQLMNYKLFRKIAELA